MTHQHTRVVVNLHTYIYKYTIACIGGSSIHWGGGHIPPTILEFSIRKATNSNSYNGGSPQNFGSHFVLPPKFWVTDRLCECMQFF